MFAARLVWRALNLGRHRFSIKMSSVSQTLSFDAYDAYGFDIDHTLAKYNLPNLFTVRCKLVTIHTVLCVLPKSLGA